MQYVSSTGVLRVKCQVCVVSEINRFASTVARDGEAETEKISSRIHTYGGVAVALAAVTLAQHPQRQTNGTFIVWASL